MRIASSRQNWWVLAVGIVTACGSTSKGDGGADVGDTDADAGAEPMVDVLHPDKEPIAPATECTVTLTTITIEPPTHVDVCSDLGLAKVPSPGGDHYPVWADFTTYEAAVPWGYLIHSMEHGGVVLSHNCDGTVCDDIVTAFEAIRDAHPADDRCPDDKKRMIIVPEPAQETPIAVAAWGATYEATCLDEDSLSAFVTDHYNMGPENTCAAGLAADQLVCP